MTLTLDDPRRVELLERAGLMGKEPPRQMTQIAAAVISIITADRCEINVIAGDDQKHVAWWPDYEPEEERVDHADESACIVVVETGEALVLDDVKNHPHCAVQSWAGTKINSYLGVPIHFEDVVIGSLCVFSMEHKHWTRGEQVSIEGMARLVEAALPG